MISPDLDDALRQLSGMAEANRMRQEWEAKLRQTCEPLRYGHVENNTAHRPNWINDAQNEESKLSALSNSYQALRDSVKNYQYDGGIVPSRPLPAQRAQCPTCGEIVYVCHVTEEFKCRCGQKLKRR